MESFFIEKTKRGNSKMIKLNRISKVFTDESNRITAIDDVSLSINAGEIYGIIGYSGAGKSTLVRMLNGLEEPTSGEVFISDEDFSQLSNKERRERRQKIGMVFQHFNLLWSRTVKENILFPLEVANIPTEEREARADELIELVGLEGREDAYPAKLSGGEKQRVGIARALANDPKILLCDEATSSLDPQTTADVLDLLLEINERLNLTIVVITHEMNVIRKICHRVAVMEAGQIVEEGDVVNIFKKPKEPATKKFIQQDTTPGNENIEKVFAELSKEYPNGKLLHLKFHDQVAQAPIISQVSRKHNVNINIIQGNIQSTQAAYIGSLYVQLLGDKEAVQLAIEAFKNEDVETEEIENDVSI